VASVLGVVKTTFGALVGLQPILADSKILESVRVEPSPTKFYAIGLSIALGIRSFITYRTAKGGCCDNRELDKKICKNLDQFGGYESGNSPPLEVFLEEARLSISVGYYILRGHSVRYEFGYRWYWQTRFNSEFKNFVCEFLEITPILSGGRNGFCNRLKDVAVCDPECAPVGKELSYDIHGLPDEFVPSPQVNELRSMFGDVLDVPPDIQSELASGFLAIIDGLSTADSEGVFPDSATEEVVQYALTKVYYKTINACFRTKPEFGSPSPEVYPRDVKLSNSIRSLETRDPGGSVSIPDGMIYHQSSRFWTNQRVGIGPDLSSSDTLSDDIRMTESIVGCSRIAAFNKARIKRFILDPRRIVSQKSGSQPLLSAG
jgi:hypothetical protein